MIKNPINFEKLLHFFFKCLFIINYFIDFQAFHTQPSNQKPTYTNGGAVSSNTEKNLKRPLSNQQNSDEEDNVGKSSNETTAASTMMDIYKQRQQKKLVKQA